MPVTDLQKQRLYQFNTATMTNYLSRPTSNLTEILFELLCTRSASIEKFGYMCGFRTRISELCRSYNLNLQKVTKTKINKYGNTYTYVNHILPDDEFFKAVKIYKQLNPLFKNK